MMDPDKMTDRLTGKMLDSTISAFTKAAQQIADAVVFFICSAAATATDPFFRKNMGERYFTPARAVLSALGWVAVLLPETVARILVLNQTVVLNQSMTGFFKGLLVLGILVAFLIPIAYIAMSIIQLNAIRDQRKTGDLWHSKSRGESLFGKEDARRDLIIEVVAVIALAFVSVLAAGFFLMSRLMCYMAEATAMGALYSRYLDIRDAQIEAEFMETALRDGFPPRQTAGLYTPLPKAFTGERRANIARIVTGGPFIAPPKESSPAPSSVAA